MKYKNYIKVNILISIFCFGLVSGLKAQHATGAISTDSLKKLNPRTYNKSVNTPAEAPQAHLDTVWANPKAHIAKVHRNQSRLRAMKANSETKETTIPSSNQSTPAPSGKPKEQ